jgi:hypothetical protein
LTIGGIPYSMEYTTPISIHEGLPTKRKEKKDKHKNDWICEKCEFSNFTYRKQCKSCGTPRENVEEEEKRKRRREDDEDRENDRDDRYRLGGKSSSSHYDNEEEEYSDSGHRRRRRSRSRSSSHHHHHHHHRSPSSGSHRLPPVPPPFTSDGQFLPPLHTNKPTFVYDNQTKKYYDKKLGYAFDPETMLYTNLKSGSRYFFELEGDDFETEEAANEYKQMWNENNNREDDDDDDEDEDDYSNDNSSGGESDEDGHHKSKSTRKKKNRKEKIKKLEPMKSDKEKRKEEWERNRKGSYVLVLDLPSHMSMIEDMKKKRESKGQGGAEGKGGGGGGTTITSSGAQVLFL